MFRLDGRVALVTGAARGIGLETARALHARGASVTLVDLDPEAAEQAAASVGSNTLALGADVTDADAMTAAVEATVERFGALDIPIANAGVAPPVASSRVIDADVFERVVEIDLLGVWRTVKPALPQVAARGGHVVVISSIYAWMNGAMNTSYAVSKAGVEQLGRSLRVELQPHGASASVAHFGYIDTAMVRNAFADPLAQRFEQTIPAWIRRRLTPAQAAGAIVTGIERRAPRIIAPGYWKGAFYLRGLLMPLLDRQMLSDTELQELARAGDAQERGELRGGLDRTATPS